MGCEQLKIKICKKVGTGRPDLSERTETDLFAIPKSQINRKRPANHASHFGIEYENVHALTGKLMGTHNDRYGSVWS